MHCNKALQAQLARKRALKATVWGKAVETSSSMVYYRTMVQEEAGRKVEGLVAGCSFVTFPDSTKRRSLERPTSFVTGFSDEHACPPCTEEGAKQNSP